MQNYEGAISSPQVTRSPYTAGPSRVANKGSRKPVLTGASSNGAFERLAIHIEEEETRPAALLRSFDLEIASPSDYHFSVTAAGQTQVPNPDESCSASSPSSLVL
ncbi:hypothetical protein HGRIS_009637 [Hohenbuehelia grisea]|uniref:Uncharacterized protein n=1 Tax=Hohenbuehelia grisea TaxID=104357 RepID=A0ABR3J1W5_9AGAR